ncbi:MAG TPA: type II toxin-antitoxin system HicA family toxin [Caulobacteraceae bacterium]|jgi:predicted RNA binding protein YcfA (HicA-like mRNA interferase family)|nr:type II toxin-antitoxin system HicA family toxin [Caulobacteraceae bacterium]
MRIIACAVSAYVYHTHVNSREVIRTLEADGWFEVAHKGSHKQFRHPTKPGRVTVIHPSRDFAPGTFRSMEKRSGLKLR